MLTIRTNIEIDARKLKEAKSVTGLKTTRAVVDFSLSRLTNSAKALDGLLALSGKVPFRKKYSYKRSR